MSPRLHVKSQLCSSSSPSSTANLGTFKIALTRESLKKDEKLKSEILKLPHFTRRSDLEIVNVPCIRHKGGEITWENIMGEGIEWIVVTSPEAARVVCGLKREAAERGKLEGGGSSGVRVAAVGKGTEKALKEGGLEVGFVPSKADGRTLGLELPWVEG
ncbi:hypothetical protein TrRE_jg10805, partial [Triparma retinervis]